MAEVTLTKTRIQAGAWEGVLRVRGVLEGQPQIEVMHLEKPLAGVDLRPDERTPGRFFLRVPIPADLLCDGVQTFVIREAQSGAKLDQFEIITGEPAEDDLRAELALLRAELDLLKAAFRRHCRDGR